MARCSWRTTGEGAAHADAFRHESRDRVPLRLRPGPRPHGGARPCAGRRDPRAADRGRRLSQPAAPDGVRRRRSRPRGEPALDRRARPPRPSRRERQARLHPGRLPGSRDPDAGRRHRFHHPVRPRRPGAGAGQGFRAGRHGRGVPAAGVRPEGPSPEWREDPRQGVQPRHQADRGQRRPRRLRRRHVLRGRPGAGGRSARPRDGLPQRQIHPHRRRPPAHLDQGRRADVAGGLQVRRPSWPPSTSSPRSRRSGFLASVSAAP